MPIVCGCTLPHVFPLFFTRRHFRKVLHGHRNHASLGLLPALRRSMTRRRGLGVLFGIVAFVALALAALLSPSSGISLGPVDGWVAGLGGIEDDLAEKTEARLTALGVRNAGVQVDGRDVTVDLPGGFPSDLGAPQLGAELLRTNGVRTVAFNAATPQASLPAPAPTAVPQATAVPEPTATPEPVAAPEIPANDIIARVDLGSILLSGDVQTDGQRAVILDALDLPDTTVVDQMQVLGADSSAEGEQQAQVTAGAIAALVEQLASGSVRLSGGVVTVEGLVADQQAADAITDSIQAATASSGTNAEVRISVAEVEIEEVVESLDLSGVNFESGTAQLRADAFAILDQAAGALAGVSDVSLEVQGHTDDQGGADLNQALSEARAAAVAEYLSSNGVDPSILAVRGYGEAEPIEDNQTEQGRAANRRVELIVIEGN